jgi:DNA-binding response OmpR family regulator
LGEDDFYIRELYRIGLERAGIEVLEATDGNEALEIFKDNHPDVVLLDIMLPELNGMEVLKYIRNLAGDDRTVPIIMITNLDNRESLEQAKKLGANDYWVKASKSPIDVARGVQAFLQN